MHTNGSLMEHLASFQVLPAWPARMHFSFLPQLLGSFLAQLTYVT